MPVELPGLLPSEAPVAGEPCGHTPPRTPDIKILAGRKMNRLERSRTNPYRSFDAQVKNIGALVSHILQLSAFSLELKQMPGCEAGFLIDCSVQEHNDKISYRL